jgi:hypothetical protein
LRPRRVIVLCAIELAIVGLIVLFPGAGHSPLLYTQLPAIILVAHLDPSAGTCVTCSPAAWTAGILAQTLLLVLMGAMINWIRRTRRKHLDRAA